MCSAAQVQTQSSQIVPKYGSPANLGGAEIVFILLFVCKLKHYPMKEVGKQAGEEGGGGGGGVHTYLAEVFGHVRTIGHQHLASTLTVGLPVHVLAPVLPSLLCASCDGPAGPLWCCLGCQRGWGQPCSVCQAFTATCCCPSG